jgi:hypothetical protein
MSCLLCVFYRVHDKGKTHGKELVCQPLQKNARQRSCLPCVSSIAHNKVFFSPSTLRINQISLFVKNFAMRFNSGARQTQVFAMRFSSTHGNT